MNAAEAIRGRVTMEDVYKRYGFQPNRAGFLVCPFHTEKTASLKMYDSGRKWKCFGCGKGGSVIDFVMELYGIDFRQAVTRINNDFGLGIITKNRRAGLREALKIKAEREKQKKLEHLAYETYLAKCDEYRGCLCLVQELRPKAEADFENLNEAYVWAVHRLPELEIWFETHNGSRCDFE